MLESRELVDKLYASVPVFREHMANKKYAQAKHVYETARNFAVFMQLDEKDMAELFGSREDEEKVVIGKFPEEDVQKAYFECSVRTLTKK